MSIIEKFIEDLIIIPLNQTEWEYGINEEYKKHAKFIEQQKNEMLEALSEEWNLIEAFLALEADNILPASYNMFFKQQKKLQEIIEKVTGITWGEMKQIVDKER